MKIHALDTPEFAPLVEARLKEVLETGEAVFESAHLCKDGLIIPVEVNAKIIEQDGAKFVFASVRDMTKRKEAERALNETVTELERFANTSVNREFRIKELKDKVAELEGEISAMKKNRAVSSPPLD